MALNVALSCVDERFVHFRNAFRACKKLEEDKRIW